MRSDHPSRRALLAGSTLGLLEAGALAATAGDTVAQPAPAQASPAAAPLSVKDFGAIADGYRHPLSERFHSLDEAHQAYPFATSLDQTLDWAAIQAAVNAARTRAFRSVRLPTGHYVIADSVRLPNGLDLHGDGAGSTFFDNEVIALAAPQLVNDEPSFVGVSIRAMSMRGGTHAVKISVPHGEIAWMFMDGVSCALQTDKNIECDRLLQSSNFNNCGFTYSPYGVYVAGHTTNAVNFFNCDFEQHSQAHLHLTGAEGVNVFGGKFEAGGALPAPAGQQRATIYLENAGAVNFHGVYFEATHELLLKEVRSRGGVSFQGCHFTGAGTSKGLIPYRFESDGLVTFGANDWYLPSEGPAQFFVQGFNGFKLGAGAQSVEVLARSPRQQRSVTGGRAVPATGVLTLATVTRVGDLAGGTALMTLELTLQGAVSRGGADLLLSRRHHLRITATPGGILGRVETVSVLDDPGLDVAIRLLPQSNEVAVIQLVLRAARGGTVQWSVDALAMAAAGGGRLEAEIPVNA